jgi:hypothetical protein
VKNEEIEEIEETGEDGPLEMKVEKSDDGGARRPAPFYKVIQGMPIAVDAFRYGKIPGVTAYLLTWVSHSHSQANVLLSKLQTRSLGPLHEFIVKLEARPDILFRNDCQSYYPYAQCRSEMGSPSANGRQHCTTEYRWSRSDLNRGESL